jgi:predicted 3-demethylubiquinone-9 3-methyltransferase (glyoxalase superfamily)
MARAITGFVPHLWYVTEAREAARFYTRLFPRSKITRAWKLVGTSVDCVEFRLLGQPLFAMSAGKHDDFNDAISFGVYCRTQKEVDRYWNGILRNGGRPLACGWIRDKYGVRWQIVPTALMEMMGDRDRKKAALVAAEMQKQVKFDIARLKQAFNGRLA